jgi:L-lactate dehydrogenase complex protein LldG
LLATPNDYWGQLFAAEPNKKNLRKQGSEVSSRDDMLERVRGALGRGTSPGPTPSSGAVAKRWPKLEGVMTPIAPADRAPTFEKEFDKVGGFAYRASSQSELERIVRTIIRNSRATTAVLTRNPLLALAGLPETLRAWGVSVALWPRVSDPTNGTSEQEYRDRCFLSEVGISGVDFILAETGSLVLSSGTEGSQLASLAPPVHVALYRCEQILGSMDDILEQLLKSFDQCQTAAGRSVTFITGPSRTGDIEQISIRGVHGPREVHAILVEEACLAECAAS